MRSVLLLEVRAQIALASQSHFVGVSIYRSPYANFYNLRALYAAAVASLMRVIGLLFSLIFFLCDCCLLQLSWSSCYEAHFASPAARWLPLVSNACKGRSKSPVAKCRGQIELPRCDRCVKLDKNGKWAETTKSSRAHIHGVKKVSAYPSKIRSSV